MSWKLKRKAQSLVASEEGVVRKDWGGRVSVALVYPNTYAVGMSNLGFQTIYEHLNALPEAVCERVFFPDPEDSDEYARTGTEPFSLESLRPLRDFDLVGFSVTYEGDYINVLRLLEPGARVALHGRHRRRRGGRAGRGDHRGLPILPRRRAGGPATPSHGAAQAPPGHLRAGGLQRALRRGWDHRCGYAAGGGRRGAGREEAARGRQPF